MKKALGVLGGMGPLATADLMRKLVLLTEASQDCEHIRTFVDSHPQIESRVEAIFGRGVNPTAHIQESLDKLAQCGAQVIAMPCITAHYFLPQLTLPVGIHFLNMPELTAEACRDSFPGKKIGVLSSPGTAKSRMFIKALEKENIEYVEPNEAEQTRLWELILNVKGNRDMVETAKEFYEIAGKLGERGAEYFAAACTELPVILGILPAPYDFIDATAELAKRAITACGYTVKQSW